MKIFFGLLFIIVCGYLSGGIEEYFKSAGDKSACLVGQIPNIDFIYIINLDQRPEKLQSSLEQLHAYCIFPYRFSAVNGWELSFEALNDLGVKYESWMCQDLWGTCYLPEDNFQPHHEVMHLVGRNYYCHCMSRGAIGIVLSHLSILQDAYDSGYETIWVMEDDIHVVRDPYVLPELIDKLDDLVGKNGWDLLFTDQDTKGRDGNYVSCFSYARRPNFSPSNPERFACRTNVSTEFRKIGARYGAYSVIVRRQGMKKILDFMKAHKVFLPYDMEYYLPNDIALYSLIEDVVSTDPVALSDNGSQNYKKELN